MIPQPAPEQPDPETLQRTDWLTPFVLLPIASNTFALNCCAVLIGTVGLGDKIVTASGPVKDGVVVEDGVVGELVLQAVNISARMTPRMGVVRPTGPAFRNTRDDRSHSSDRRIACSTDKSCVSAQQPQVDE